MFLKNLSLAVALVAISVSSAPAGVIVDLDYNSRGTYGVNLGSYGIDANYASGSYGGWAGQLDITVTGSGSFNYDGDHLVYCTELGESAGALNDYLLDSLDNLDVPTSGTSMGLSQKIAMEKLFSLVGTVDTNLEASAFQVAVWEISHDENFGDATAGTFNLSGSGTAYDLISGKANDYLNALAGLSQVSVLGMIADGSQDFLDANPELGGISTIPEPATSAIFGAIGLIACCRRRTSKA